MKKITTEIPNRITCFYTLMTLFVLLTNMPSVFGQTSSVLVFAHRGGRAEGDENTLSAYKNSYKKGLRGFETDIRITKDSQLVIHHDADFKKIGVEGTVEQMTLAEIKAIRTKKGNPIPTLDELLEFFNSKPGLTIEFELKTLSPLYDQKLLEYYVDEIYKKLYANMPATSEYFFTSFDKRPLKYIKSKYATAPMLLINNVGLSQQVLDDAKELGVSRIGCRIEGTTRAMMREAHKQGFKVSLGPTPTINDFLLAVALEADYVCPDIPAAVYKFVKKKAPWIKLIHR